MQHMNWKKYVEQTARIRTLSSPRVHNRMKASNYYEILTENFMEIRSLALSNRHLLKEEINPYLSNMGDLLEEETIEELLELQNALIDAYNMENLDMAVVTQITDRLYADAAQKQDIRYMVEQLDAQVSAYYTLLNMQKRMLPYAKNCEKARKKAMDAANELLTFLDKERFAQLPDNETKEIVLVNSRYMCALFEGLHDEATKERELTILRNALSLEDDSFYREQVSEYDWEYHRVRTLEYFGIMTEFANEKKLIKEECREIWEHCKELKKHWEESEKVRKRISESEILLCICRSGYYAGELSLDDYKEELLHLYKRRDPNGYSIGDIFQNILVPLEYLLQIDVERIGEKDIDLLSGIYNDITNYVFCMQNTGSFSYLLEYFVAFMRNFIELPGQMTFMDACLNGIAALHPPTYVHTIMVGRIAKCFCRHLILLHPEAFVGMFGYKNVEEVTAHRFELEEYIFRGALCHDIGKFLIMDTIFIYGRNLTDDEFDIIKTHPDVGAQIMSNYSSTRPYADIARGHHKWYNNQAGYPEYNTEESDVKLLIDLVACADCLDAATDTVGRSYNTGKSFTDVFDELIEQSGTRYTPYIVDLLKDEDTLKDIEYLLKDGRKEVYYNTFVRLVTVQKSVQ